MLDDPLPDWSSSGLHLLPEAKAGSSCETGLCKPTAVPVKAKTSNQNIQVTRIHVPVVRMQVCLKRIKDSKIF